MKKLNNVGNCKFYIGCKCGNKHVNFNFTKLGNIIIICRICGNSELIENEK